MYEMSPPLSGGGKYNKSWAFEDVQAERKVFYVARFDGKYFCCLQRAVLARGKKQGTRGGRGDRRARGDRDDKGNGNATGSGRAGGTSTGEVDYRRNPAGAKISFEDPSESRQVDIYFPLIYSSSFLHTFSLIIKQIAKSSQVKLQLGGVELQAPLQLVQASMKVEMTTEHQGFN
jgi:hypothetical protein